MIIVGILLVVFVGCLVFHFTRNGNVNRSETTSPEDKLSEGYENERQGSDSSGFSLPLSILLNIHKKYNKKNQIQSLRGLLDIYEKMDEELEAFIEKHDFSLYTPNVGVFGENSTGKSTFLNAMLGNKEQFKMGFGETTNKITALYKTKKPSNIGGLSISFEKRDYNHLNYMNLFDIPGFGQQFPHDKLQKIMGKMDVVFWFVDASKGVKKDDKLFLEDIKGFDIKVIVVLNKIDAVSEIDEVNSLIKDINAEISKIYTFFKEESLEKNIVSVFPFSATKSLIGRVKGEQGAFKIIDKIVQNVLLYTVFIQSYRAYIDLLFGEEISLLEVETDAYDIITQVCMKLEYELKDNISMMTSLSPFYSKDEKAEPIVMKHTHLLKESIDAYNESAVEYINESIENNLNYMESFDAFGQSYNMDLQVEKIQSIDVDIDLNSMAWDSFFGDSFAEEVTAKFQKKVTKLFDRQLPEILGEYEERINTFQNDLKNNAQTFANTIDHKLSTTTKKIQEPLLTLLIKAVQKTLDEKENELIQRALNVS